MPPGSPSVSTYLVVRPDTRKVLRDAQLPCFFVDASGILKTLNAWLDLQVECHGNCEPVTGRAYDMGYLGTSPLIINGHIKSGKTFILSIILPACVRNHPRFGVGCDKELQIWSLNFASITAQGTRTYRQALVELLTALNTLALDCGSTTAAVDLLWTDGQLEAAVRKLLWSLPQRVLILIDEVQAWFLLKNDVEYIGTARYFLKDLLCSLPPWVFAAVTGSSMCCFWSNIAATARNGVTLMTHHMQLTLPAESEPGFRAACSLLQMEAVQYPTALEQLCPHQPAMLVHMLREYIAAGRPQDVAMFVKKHEQLKIMTELSADVGAVLALLSEDQRLGLLGLCTEDGVSELDPSLAGISQGLSKWLDNMFETPAPGRLQLASLYHRNLIKLLIGPDGSMRNPLQDYQAGPILLAPARELLRDFGESCKDLDDTTAAGKLVKNFLQGLASEKHVQQDDVNAWLDKLCKATQNNVSHGAALSAAQWLQKNKGSMEPWQRLAQGFRMARNILSHTSASRPGWNAEVDMLVTPFAKDIRSLITLLTPVVKSLKLLPSSGGDESSQLGHGQLGQPGSNSNRQNPGRRTGRRPPGSRGSAGRLTGGHSLGRNGERGGGDRGGGGLAQGGSSSQVLAAGSTASPAAGGLRPRQHAAPLKMLLRPAPRAAVRLSAPMRAQGWLPV